MPDRSNSPPPPPRFPWLPHVRSQGRPTAKVDGPAIPVNWGIKKRLPSHPQTPGRQFSPQKQPPGGLHGNVNRRVNQNEIVCHPLSHRPWTYDLPTRKPSRCDEPISRFAPGRSLRKCQRVLQLMHLDQGSRCRCAQTHPVSFEIYQPKVPLFPPA